MDVCKHFLAGLRNVTLNAVYLILNKEDLSPKLLQYIEQLTTLPYKDGLYHTYYGEVKRLVDSFVMYWAESMDETVKEADKVTHIMNKDTLLRLIDNTIEVHKHIAKFFDKMFLPIETPGQQLIYDDLNNKYQKHLEGLSEMQSVAESLDRQFKVLAFTKDKIPGAVDKKYEVFQYAHTYIAMLLADHIPEMRGSLIGILRQLRSNIKELREKSNLELNALIDELYDKHKEQLRLSRREMRPSADALEIDTEIERLRQRVVEHTEKKQGVALEEEAQYFAERLEEFERIANTLNKLKVELEAIEREEAAYKSIIMTELPGTKYQCWENIGRNCAERKEFVKEKTIQASRTLVTFFAVRGPTRMTYSDNVGTFFVDTYGHQVYSYDSKLQVLHVDCEKQFKSLPCQEVHFFDELGRYILKDGQKIYQNMNCTSSYRLGEDNLLEKITVDCGHSEKFNPNCGMTIKDPTDVVILPKTEHVDIKRTLNEEVVRYLWEAVGAILPLALYDVGMLQPKNPIYHLAHRLIVHKYGKTTAEHRKLKQEAEEYRARISKERKDKAVSESKAWKAKQVKRRKPEESHDYLERSVYETYVATNELINMINFYNLA